MLRNHENSLVFSYLALRKAVGWIGLTLPIILMIGGFVLQILSRSPYPRVESSISAYYHTGMRNVFVGLLCAIGIFHLATYGYDVSDRIAGRLACIFAFGVAWFPTTPYVKPPGFPTPAQCYIGYLHYIFSALLFLTLAFFCIFQFTQTVDVKTRTRRKKERNAVYYVCGGTILVCIAVCGTVGLFMLLGIMVSLCDWLESWKWNFWFESLALFAFGTAFLIKGEFLLKDKPAPIQPDKCPQDDRV